MRNFWYNAINDHTDEEKLRCHSCGCEIDFNKDYCDNCTPKSNVSLKEVNYESR